LCRSGAGPRGERKEMGMSEKIAMLGLGMPSLEEMRRARLEQMEAQRPKTAPEARAAHLREMFERQQDNRFEPGDLVTPMPDAGVNPAYVGEPHVVMAKWIDGDDPMPYYRVTTIDVDGGAQTADLFGWQLSSYEVPA
jgi:hypothetical protein